MAALNKLADMCVTEYVAEGGTMIVPAHVVDGGCRRPGLLPRHDGDRAQPHPGMIDKGMTLAQVRPPTDHGLRPTVRTAAGLDFPVCRGMYRSLTQKKAK